MVFRPTLLKFKLCFISLNTVRFFLTTCQKRRIYIHTVKGLNLGVISKVGWVNVVLNRTVVVDSDWRFDNLLSGSHLQRQSELYHVNWWYYTLVIHLIGKLRRDVIGNLSVKPWCYWLWRLVISNWCVSTRLLSQFNSRLLWVKLLVLQYTYCSIRF